MAESIRPVALVTGASTGLGFALARCCAEHGFDLIIAADEPGIRAAAAKLRQHGAVVEAIEADLATVEGVDKLLAAVLSLDRPIDAVLSTGHRQETLRKAVQPAAA